MSCPLEVMDRSAVWLGLNAPQVADEIAEARAAVVELVAAATKASATLGHAYHTTLTGELADHAHTDYQRLDAALAKFGEA